TNANDLLSGDHDETLIVPCPPKSFVTSRIFSALSLSPGSGIARSTTSWLAGWPFVPFLYDRNSSHLPSGEGCGNQSSYSSLVTPSALTSFSPAPPAGIRQISQLPERSELK